MSGTDTFPLCTRTARTGRGVAVLVPGFLDGGDDPAVDAMARAARADGFTTVGVEPRWAGRGPGDPADVGPSTQLADIARLVDVHGADRTVLIGHCYGALLAGLAAAVDPRVTDVVALMPTRCFIWPEDYDVRRDTWRQDGRRRFVRGHREITVPYSVVDDALGHDLPAALAGLRQRILFVAGERDELIGVEPVRRLHEECGSLDKTLTVLPVQHDFRDLPAETAVVTDTVLAWLTAVSGPRPDLPGARPARGQARRGAPRTAAT